MENGKPVFKTQMYSYRTPALAGFNLKPGGFEYADQNDIEYTPVPLQVEEFDENVTITGSVNLAYETGFRKGAFKTAQKADVEFEILYAGMANPLNFGTTTDENGNYKITLPMKSLSQGFTINDIKVLGIGDNEFKHWTSDTITEIVKGAYELAGIAGNSGPGGAAINFANVINGITYDLGAKNLLFKPYYNAGITNIPEPENWSDDLLGWALGRTDLGFNESYTKTVTLTGTVYMPYLKDFGVGAYKTERQTIKLSSPWVDNTDPMNPTTPYQDLVVITDEDGTFSVDLPVNCDDVMAFTIALEKDDQPFTFINAKGKKIEQIKGTYDAADIVNIQEEGADWYDLGDFYCKYSFANPADEPDDWNADLIGWYKSDVYDKINANNPVVARFLFAVEKSFGEGKYEPKPYIITINVDDDKDGNVDRTIAVKTDEQGYINFDLPLEDEFDTPDLSIANDNYTFKEYVHYTEYGKSESMLLNDDYTLYKKVYDKKDQDKIWNETLGTRYYKFATATLPANLPDTFHKNLVGWFIKTDAKDIQYAKKASATGKALQAVETSFLTGKYDNSKGQVLTITITYPTGADNVEVLSDANGNIKFDVPLKNDGDEPQLGVAADDIEVDDFVHYINSSNKKKILTGAYSGTAVKSSTALWNELGTIYYQFEPTAGEKADLWDGWDNYSKYISGWIYKKDYTQKGTVTGKVLLAKEESFWVGSYEEGKGIPVRIDVDYGKDGFDYGEGDLTFVVPTKMTGETAGEFSIDVLLKYADDDPDVAWYSAALDAKDLGLEFKHFRNPGSDVTEVLEGNFSEKATIKTSSNWKEQGTRSYKFNNTGATKNWESNLSGWDVWGAAYKTPASIIGAIRIAGEKVNGSTIEPTWEPAKFAKATVSVSGKNYRICTGEDGKFNFTIYFTEAKADLPASLALTIDPDDIEDTSMNHWTDDTDKNSRMTATGKFYSANNVNATPVDKAASGSSYDLTKAAPFSAKMYFDFDAPKPTSWDTYDWASIVNDEK